VLVGLSLDGLDLGASPPRLEGVKAYERTREDEIMLEAPVVWVSGLSVRIARAPSRFPALVFHPLRAWQRARPPNAARVIREESARRRPPLRTERIDSAAANTAEIKTGARRGHH